MINAKSLALPEASRASPRSTRCKDGDLRSTVSRVLAGVYRQMLNEGAA